jgi:hypothetical protein
MSSRGRDKDVHDILMNFFQFEITKLSIPSAKLCGLPGVPKMEQSTRNESDSA